MRTLRDTFLESSLDELVAAAEAGKIDPDELWTEVLDSVHRSVVLLSRMSRASGPPEGFDEQGLREKQDRIDGMIARWRSELESAGMLPDELRAGRTPKAAHSG
jgi:hypothetical protein